MIICDTSSASPAKASTSSRHESSMKRGRRDTLGGRKHHGDRSSHEEEEETKRVRKSVGRFETPGPAPEKEKSMTSESKLDLASLYNTVEQYIYVISGFHDSPLASVERFDVQRGIWTEMPEIGLARTKFATISTTGGKIFVLGGKQADGTRTSRIEEFDCKRNTWTQSRISMPRARSGFAAVLYNGHEVYAIGGNDGHVLNRVDKLDLKTGRWESLPPMNKKRDELSVTIGPDGRIYAIGGYGGADNSCLRSAERFDPVLKKWEMLPQMNEPRRALSAVTLPDGVYALGGYNGQDYLASVERFDEAAGEWIEVCPMNASRCTLSAASSPDCQHIYAIGGFDGMPLSIVERYNVVDDAWEFVTPMKEKRFMHSAVSRFETYAHAH